MVKNITATSEIIIDADPGRVWQVLINPENVQTYMLGMEPQSDWKAGSELRWKGRHEEKPDDNARGKILEMTPGRNFSYSFYYPGYGYPDEPAYYNQVSLQLEEAGNSTKIIAQQGDFAVFKEGEEFVKHTRQFWDVALQKIKELTESGE